MEYFTFPAWMAYLIQPGASDPEKSGERRPGDR